MAPPLTRLELRWPSPCCGVSILGLPGPGGKTQVEA